MQAQLRSQDIVEPTAVQAASIPRVLQGGNVAMQCYTGSGKVQHLSVVCVVECSLLTEFSPGYMS